MDKITTYEIYIKNRTNKGSVEVKEKDDLRVSKDFTVKKTFNVDGFTYEVINEYFRNRFAYKTFRMYGYKDGKWIYITHTFHINKDNKPHLRREYR